MDLAIVIVNYKTALLTIECLKSLQVEKELVDISVVVVDNKSNDSSFDQIQKYVESENLHDWIQVIASDFNGGFSYGNNIGIRYFLNGPFSPEYFCLLNPDTTVHPHAMRLLIDFMRKNPKVGIAGSRLEYPDGSAQLSAFKFHNWKTELALGFSFNYLTKLLKSSVNSEIIPLNNTQTDWVAGASMIIRPEVFDDIGLLDESYFMYYEELDFCLQAAKAGWSCWYIPESRVVHYVGQSSGITDNKVQAKRRPKYWFDSRRRYFLKNYGFFHTLLADISWLTGFGVWRFRNFFQKKPHNHPPAFWRDSFANSIFCRGTKIDATKNKIGRD